mmetsp:Transcript_16254/g.35186  ORF Transcript_16254/g.35186 Transcript_16254/m.35186 type:complete len:1212 (-) Transcript_16254:224-3859(-)|eukprot:CAMPEP_0206474164 /NCGR_PEP_ID=MMETSP0324_2-20121206/33314_1 /ASSEMBLY_ACC=CAM_ASM_000836 /TAXON_ID=2866 /ORGANISM="Crypthecodinium cohnii, Strain Seligo" /LENGTH=1211 /DNA_ID=CAMNT_0053949265 /DNA_START=231 /DNA_END=3866 /DNA_ORIENTATION=+
MHIKQVIIRGFKTYKEQTSLDQDFSPGTNVVVGFNGSGKSNFFQAILFVLSDQYTSLRAESRRAILHEGAGQAVLTAYVEVVLDNTDRRIPIDNNQVAIRRLIGIKKDDWLLDGKHSTKAEIFGLLESAGFAKSSPYYIVQQGKVSELTMMSDVQRLGLLKDISGAGIYDERKAESLKIMEDTSTRRTRTESLIVDIRNKLKGLESEQRELRECEILEARKRTLEYVLADREWRSAQDRFEELDARRSEASAKLQDLQLQVAGVRKETAEASTEMERQEEARKRASEQASNLEAQRDKIFEALAAAKVEADNDSRLLQESATSGAARSAQIGAARKEVETMEKELGELRPKAEAVEKRLRDIDQRRQVASTLREQLVAKQGRKQQYSSIEERNKALDEEIKRSTERLTTANEKLARCSEKIENGQELSAKTTAAAQQKREELISAEKALSTAGSELRALGEKLDQAAEQQRLFHQKRSELSRQAESLREEAAAAKHRLEATMPKASRSAAAAVERWAIERRWEERLRGTLLSHIQVQSAFRAAVEAFAGMALFNVLAMDDEAAAEAVKFVRTKRLGSVVVTPLSQIRVGRHEYPDIDGVKPLVEVISCPDWARPAVQQVFGRGVVCRTMELCEQVARTHGLDAITLDGDRVSRRGVVTGGFQDPGRFVRLTLSEQYRALQRKAASCAAQIPQMDENISEASARLESLHGERRSQTERRDALRTKLHGLTEEVQSLEEDKSKQARQLSELGEWKHRMEVLIKECETSVQGKRQERSSKTWKNLTTQEEQQLASLTDEVKELEVALESAKTESQRLRATLEDREARLEGCLRKRLHGLEREAASGGQEDAALDGLERSSLARGRLEREHREACDGAAAALKSVATAGEALEAIAKRVGELTAKEGELQEEAAQGALRVERLEAEARAQEQRKAEVDGRLRSLTAAAGEVEKCRQLPKPQLVRELGDVGKKLQAFQHVNRKAVEQFENFAEQLRDLETRLKDIDSGESSIQKALEKIDAQKESTLLQTLNRMDEFFQQVFVEMVPGGKGRLQVLRDSKGSQNAADGPLSGVQIEVSFTGQEKSFLVMSQLSGGQKTVVALSLIFAIQRLEPAPFYLLDECDAALDASYRTALANLVSRTASMGSQVILTTFRPEALDKADRCYRVYQQNRASRIDAVTCDQARQVLREQDRLAEAEAAAAAMAGGSAQGVLTMG